MDIDYKKIADIAMQAALEGGDIARRQLGNLGSVQWKGSMDVSMPVTTEIQDRIIEILRSEYPDIPILSEELEPKPPPDSDALWIVDPIDGSLNYMKGIPSYAVSIGFRHKKLYRVGVVYDPSREELFHAIRNQGSFMNGSRIKTSWFSEGVEAYLAAFVASDWPDDLMKRKQTVQVIDIMMGDVVSINIFGSPALAICQIAAGRLDAYFNLQLNLWDIAAAVVILEDAGGVLTDLVGATWEFSDGGYLATNGKVHGRMLDPIRLARLGR
jgi:myo-inositol-1(or 4)-monophosphatase